MEVRMATKLWVALATGLLLLAAPVVIAAQWTTNGNDVYKTNTAGNVGIGTATPGEKLVIMGNVTVGNINAHTQLYSGYDSQAPSILEVGYGTATSSDVPFSALVLSKNATGTSQYIGSLFWANRAIADGNERRLAQIGVATDGATNSGLLTFNLTDAGTLAERMRITKSGNVGIGTPTPAALLSVSKNQASGTEIRIDNGNAAGFAGLYMNGGFAGTTGGFVQYNNVTGYRNLFLATASSDPLYLGTENSIRMTVLPGSGNVGIGLTSPTEKLEIDGNLKLTGTGNINATGTIEAGNIKAKYQDLAEWVPSSEKLAAGTVVVLDTTKSNQVISSGTAYDTRVAGVISAQPGITLGEGGEGKVLVATTGRVRVKVDASRAPIQIGDLLVTSDVPGVAMKSEPVEFAGRKMHMPGTIIGKALEPLAKGSGEILVLLSLQ